MRLDGVPAPSPDVERDMNFDEKDVGRADSPIEEKAPIHHDVEPTVYREVVMDVQSASRYPPLAGAMYHVG